ncbi:hypothetical protein BT69DRAFT_876488 [Atractiella rhizophila]|nr:hypothetical protein BT69DRAFT_876488 [Atractiella rhizophila]
MATLDILGLGKGQGLQWILRRGTTRMGLHLASPRSERMRSLNTKRTPCFGLIFELYKVQSTASLPAWSRMARDILSIPGARDTIGIRRHRLKPSTIRLLIITKAKLRLDRTRERMELLRKLEEAEKMHEMQVLAKAQS